MLMTQDNRLPNNNQTTQEPTTTNAYRRSTTKSTKRKIWPLIVLSLLIIIVLAATVIGVTYWLHTLPNDQLLTVLPDSETRVIYDHKIDDTAAVKIIDGQAYMSHSMAVDRYDPYLHWDSDNQLLIKTTEMQVLKMRTDQLTAFFNEQPVELELPVLVIEEVPYLPMEFFARYYPYTYKYVAETDVLFIDTPGKAAQRGQALAWADPKRVAETIKVREEADHKRPIVSELLVGEQVWLLGEVGEWYHVLTEQGIYGYAKKIEIGLAGIRVIEAPVVEKRPVTWKPLGSRINLTWEAVYSRTPNPEDIPDLPGVNVISPTWFSLKDAQGNVSGNKASLEYVRWAQQEGMQVWGLYENQFDPELTSAFLKQPEARLNSIRQLLAYAEMFELDGINIDFENIYYRDRALLTQYVRELTPYLREQGLVVSIDVTFISLSENWSMVYDRVAYADTVDYIMVMAYDEHWGSSPVAGSVSSLPWVEGNLERILEEIPAHKLLLGVPFYTRVWQEEPQTGGGVKVTSRAVSMGLADEIIEEKNAEITYDAYAGQYYAEYYEGNNRFRIWLETEESMEKRLELVRKYELAGVASWRRGFEKPEIWETIQRTLETR